MHGPVNVVAHDYAVSEYKIHMFAREDNTDAGDGDPVKGTDEPVAAAETRGEGDDDSLSEADLRDQFQNDFEYLLPPFGSPQVDVVHDPRTGKDEVITTKRVHQVQGWVDRHDKMGEDKGYTYWEISYLHAFLWLYQRRLG
jgi:hypothetical protein